MATPNPVNSVMNFNLPKAVADSVSDPEVKSLADQVVLTFANVQQEMERYLGITQKDITTWANLLPSDTLLTHQVRRLYVKASEALIFGDLVNLHNVAGVLNARKANGVAGTVRPARGFCSTVAGIGIGAIGEIVFKSGILAIAGILPGQDIYLSAVAGLATTAPLVGVGQLEQYIGTGVASNLAFIDMTLGQYIQH